MHTSKHQPENALHHSHCFSVFSQNIDFIQTKYDSIFIWAFCAAHQFDQPTTTKSNQHQPTEERERLSSTACWISDALWWQADVWTACSPFSCHYSALALYAYLCLWSGTLTATSSASTACLSQAQGLTTQRTGLLGEEQRSIGPSVTQAYSFYVARWFQCTF